MAANDSSTATFQDDSTLIPELLENSRLIEILEKQCIKTKRNLNTLSKADLVALFHKYVTSFPQRRWRENRRGRKMNKFIEENIDGTVSTVSYNEDRLKKPPSSSQSVNVNSRFIKLNNYQKSNKEEMKHPNDQKRRRDNIIGGTYDQPVNKSRKISWP